MGDNDQFNLNANGQLTNPWDIDPLPNGTDSCVGTWNQSHYPRQTQHVAIHTQGTPRQSQNSKQQ